ncbi:hypothetical protein OF846_003168 [Rhodotorula toruloides]|nr:hypothetical protein OF846_003168 [Rhodotorula toruloides]
MLWRAGPPRAGLFRAKHDPSRPLQRRASASTSEGRERLERTKARVTAICTYSLDPLRPKTVSPLSIRTLANAIRAALFLYRASSHRFTPPAPSTTTSHRLISLTTPGRRQRMQNEADLYTPRTYSATDFVIGLFITLAASLTNALGLNITKLDYTRQEALPPSQRRPDFLRIYWLLGLGLYIASQVVGSTLALEYLRAEYVAPLGSTSLIFNFIFAYLLVSTPVTRLDILGTVVIILGVVGVVVFSNIRKETPAIDAESNLSLSLLKEIWGRSDWIAYLVMLEVATIALWWLSRIVFEVCQSRVLDERGDADRDADLDAMVGGGGGRRVANPYEGEGWVGRVKSWRDGWHKAQGRARKVVKRAVQRWSEPRPDASIRQLSAFCWAVTSGLLSGQTLILAKSGVKLVTSAIQHSDPNEPNQFSSPLTWLIVILLVVCAITQVYALNLALKAYDSTFVIPVMFATYTVSAFLNTLVYLDQTKTYRLSIFLLIWVSIAILIAGVVMLSMKKQPKRTRPARSGSTASPVHGRNPFDDPAAPDSSALDSPTKPGFARAYTGASGDVEAGAVPEAEPPVLRKGQGWWAKLFGGLPADAATSAPASTPDIELSQAARRKQAGVERLDDGDSVLASERTSQRGAEELEMDDVDGLGRYAPSVRSSVGKPGEEDDDFGEFEKATGAERVDDDQGRHPLSAATGTLLTNDHAPFPSVAHARRTIIARPPPSAHLPQARRSTSKMSFPTPPPPLETAPSYIRCAPGSKRVSRRRICLFLDGTGNSFGSNITNLPILFSLANEDPTKALLYYQAGVGETIATHEAGWMPSKIYQKVSQIIDEGIAYSLGDHICKGYKFLMDPGDEVFLFGFSRGAFTARALAGMLEAVGLLPAGNEETIPLAFSIYKRKTETILFQSGEQKETVAQGFKRTFSREIEVHFVGVWDTVSSVGSIIPRTLPFASGSSWIHHFRQAFALDERRARYTPQHWIGPAAQADRDHSADAQPGHGHGGDERPVTTVKEVYFAGAHSNVGGGEFPYDGDHSPALSHLSLKWMVREAVEAGFELDTYSVSTSPIFGPFVDKAREALRSLDKYPDLDAYLDRTMENNPEANELMAATVYLAARPSPQSTADALAPRADHLSFAIEEKPEEVKDKLSFGARLADFYARISARAMTSFWWLLEILPTIKVAQRADAHGKKKVSFWPNFGRGRILPSHPNFHYSVLERMSAAPAKLASEPGNNENVPEGSQGYKPHARFREGRGMKDVRFVE